jgi:hypothetical protein
LPAAFTFTPITNASLNSVNVSNSVSITGINTVAYVTYGAASTGTVIEGSTDGGTTWIAIPASGLGFPVSNSDNLLVRLTTDGTVSSANTATSAGFATTAGSADSATTATTATSATNIISAGSGVPYNSGASTTAFLSGLGTDGQVVTTTGSALGFTSQSALAVGSATSATNVAGGTTGALVVQSGAGASSFITAPASNLILMGNGAGVAPTYKQPILYVGVNPANVVFPATPFTAVTPAAPVTLGTTNVPIFAPGSTTGFLNVFVGPTFNVPTDVTGTFRFSLQLSPLADFSSGVVPVFNSAPFVMTAEASATGAQLFTQIPIGGLTAATSYFMRLRLVQSSNTTPMACTTFAIFNFTWSKTGGF